MWRLDIDIGSHVNIGIGLTIKLYMNIFNTLSYNPAQFSILKY